MVFSSSLFLFLFLPIILLVYATLSLTPERYRRTIQNIFLLLVSLYFYAWGESSYLLVMIGSIAGNHLIGKNLSAEHSHRKQWVSFGIILNLLLLFFFKYSSFFIGILSNVLISIGANPLPIPHPHLPLGISFFTFQAMSYLIDCYRGVSTPQKSIFGTALYIALFPQLIAGPIVRYHSIAHELQHRKMTLPLFEYGITRFCIGLGKKVLIANTLGEFVDYAFALPEASLTPAIAWLALISYALQIYYDFSGYSDMAIGLGAFFGFHFPENFRTPYAARSLREFWQRWHITLSEWFRDYLYFPLGGSRGTTLQTARNLLVVFLLCGLWHGAAWNFVLWGLLHGFFLSLERGLFGNFLKTLPRVLQHIYLLLVVLLSWVLFRAENLSQASEYYRALFGLTNASADPFLFLRFNHEVLLMLCIGALLSFFSLKKEPSNFFLGAMQPALTLALLILSAAKLASGSYNPFIYFRF